MCHQWASRGRCDYGTACKFSHQRMDHRWNHEHPLDDKKIIAAMLSGLSPQEALTQALNNLNSSNPQKYGGVVPSGDPSSSSAAGAVMPDGLGPNGLAPPGLLMPGQSLVQPQKRADGSLILCRFYARHGSDQQQHTDNRQRGVMRRKLRGSIKQFDVVNQNSFHFRIVLLLLMCVVCIDIQLL